MPRTPARDSTPRRRVAAVSAAAVALIPLAAETTARATPSGDEAPPGIALTAAGALGPADAVRLALELNPSYQAALTSAQRLRLLLEAESARYTPTLTAGLDYTRATTTSLSRDGVLRGTSDSVNGVVGLSNRFDFGLLLSAELSLSGDQRQVVSPIINEPIRTGPGYGVNLRVSATQPLLRGLGRDIGLASARIARINADAAGLSERRAASALTRDTVIAWAELWYAERALAIQRAAREVAERALTDAGARVKAGDLAELGLLPLETDLATIDEAILAADGDLRRRRIALGRLIGWPTSAAGAVGAAPDLPAAPALPPREELLAFAAANAPELAELRAAVARADIEAGLAKDRATPRLDATAWLNVGGLGDKDPLDAFAMWAGLEAVTFFIGLDFELPVDRTQLRSEAGARRLAAAEARQQLAQAEQTTLSSAADLHEAWTVAEGRLALARKTADVAARSAEAQKVRLDTGVGTVLEWLSAEQEARRARLRVERLAADVIAAAASALHTAGELLGSPLVAAH